MSGISSSVGLVSGLNSQALIEQLLRVDSRPRTLAQQRLVELQGQQAALLDVNSRLTAMRSAATTLRTNNIFNTAGVSSTAESVMTATARPGAAAGTYSFLVDRVVSTQQFLSRGFVDRGTSAAGIASVSVEPARARLDSDTSLSALNGGTGVARGRVEVVDSTGATATVDLSKAVTASDVLDAFNSARGVNVRASVEGGRFVLRDLSAGSGNFTVRSASGFTTAESLGVNASGPSKTVTGSVVYRIGDSTGVSALNDGNGVRLNRTAGNATFDFTIRTRDGSVYQVDIGEMFDSQGVRTSGAAGTVGQLRERISSQTAGKVTLGVSADGRSLTLTDSTSGGSNFAVEDSSGAAADLGLVNSTTDATFTGRRVLAGLNSTLASGLAGGAGLGDGRFNVTARDGSLYALDLSGAASVSDVFARVAAETDGKITLALNERGTGVVLTDTTGGTGSLVVEGGAARALGVLAEAGVSASTITGGRVPRRYVAESTLLSSLNNGQGVGLGSFTIQGPRADQRATIRVENGVDTVGQLIARINSAQVGVVARINDEGNGILVARDPAVTSEAIKISITDTTGAAARNLNLAGEASGLGADNFVNGSQRRTVTVGAGETLDSAVSKLNAARAGVTASVLTDGATATPFRLRLSSTVAGSAGRLIIESSGADLGLTTAARGDDSRVFFGSDDPARAILVSRSSNTIDGVIENVSVQARSVSATPVTLTVSRDDDAVIEDVKTFVSTFNTLYSRVNDLTRFNRDTERRGVLLGDSTVSSLRAELQAVVGGRSLGNTGQFTNLAQVGVTVGRNGELSLNESRLRSALSTDAQSVAEVFSGFVAADRPDRVNVIPGNPSITTRNTAATSYTKLGVLERLAQLADRYLSVAGGLLTARTNNVASQITAQNGRLTQLDTRLEAKRAQYERQFANLETSLSRLRNQQSSLGSLSSLTAQTAQASG